MTDQDPSFIDPTARLFWMAHYFRIAATYSDRYELECLDYENPRTLPKAKVSNLKLSGDLVVEPFYFDWDGKPAERHSPTRLLASRSPAVIRQTMLAYTKAKMLDRAYKAGKVALYETQPKPRSGRRRRHTGKLTVDVWLKENEAAIQAACYPYYLLDPSSPKPREKPRVGQFGLPSLGSPSKIKQDRAKLARKGFKITDLCPNIEAMRRGGRRMAPDMAKLVENQIREVLLRPERMTLAQFRRHVAAVLKDIKSMANRTVPSAHAIENLIGTLKDAQVIAARFGIKKATESRTIYTENEEYSYPGELVLMDCWRFDLVARINTEGGGWIFVSDPDLDEWGVKRRLWVAWVIDACSRTILGLALGFSESSELTTRALRMAVTAKTLQCEDAGCEATPLPPIGLDGLLTDIGGAFTHPHFMVPALSLVPDADVGPGDSAHLRGLLERFNRTVKDQLLAYFTGTTFGNVVEKADYDAMERASLDADTLGRMIWRWINDVYNLSPHRGLDGQPPINRFEDRYLSSGVPDVYTEEDVRIAFGKEFMLPVTREGVCFASNHYYSGRLQAFVRDHGTREHGRPRKLRAKVDLSNLGRISVWIDEDGDWRTLAGPRRVQGVGFTTWQRTRQTLKKRYGDQAAVHADIVARALLEIQSVGTAAQLQAHVRDMSYDSEDVVKAVNRIRLRIKEDETPMIQGAFLAFDSSTDEAAYPVTGRDDDIEAEIEAANDPYADVEATVRGETELGLDNGDIDQDGDPLVQVEPEPQPEPQPQPQPVTLENKGRKRDPKPTATELSLPSSLAFLPQPKRK